METLIYTALTIELGLRKYMHDSFALLALVRSGLADLLQQILDGDVGAFKELAEKRGELEKALKRVFEAEDQFNEWYAREADQGLPGDIDFDAVREEIGCRLARIRKCCGSD